MLIDEIDFQIIELLSKNSRMQWKDIGKHIHLTGQAVGNRIKKLEENGVIKAYSIVLDELKLGFAYFAFVTVFMKTTDHNGFIDFIKSNDAVREAHKISGEGCYLLKIRMNSQEQLNEFLSKILVFGNYRLNISIHCIKKA